MIKSKIKAFYADENFGCIVRTNVIYSIMRKIHIQKPHQKTLKTAASLQKKKYRDIEKKFLIEGILPLEEAVRSNYRITEIFFSHDVLAKPGVTDLLLSAEKKHKAVCYEISDSEMKKISCEKTPQGIAAVAEKKTFTEKDLNGNILLLDKIRDPGNAGTLFRIAHWFGLGGIVMINESVDVCNPKTVRASMGSVFHIPYLEVDELPECLGKKRTILLSRAHGGNDIRDIDKEQLSPFVLVIGNESRGISAKFTRYSYLDISLPSLGDAESLNAATAAAAILSKLLY